MLPPPLRWGSQPDLTCSEYSAGTRRLFVLAGKRMRARGTHHRGSYKNVNGRIAVARKMNRKLNIEVVDS